MPRSASEQESSRKPVGLPASWRWTLLFATKHGIAEVDVAWAKARAWSENDKAQSGWTTLPVGPFVIALRHRLG